MKSRVLFIPLVASIAAVFVPIAGASAADVPTVPLSTAEAYSVLAGSTVTNTGPSILNDSLGLSPGSSVTGFPPGIITAPGIKNIANPAAVTAKANLTTAYLNAEGRSISATVKADLAGLTLGPGVYAATGKGALRLSGSLTLNANGNENAVFIFQTNSTLITASSSTMILTNGANACRVFWQVGSSATLGTSSRFKGSILALTSISATTNARIEGRLLARNGAVTLDTNTFTEPSCVQAPVTTTTARATATTVRPTATTVRPTTTSTIPSSETTLPVPDTTLPGTGMGSNLWALSMFFLFAGFAIRILRPRYDS